jgi:hypothetical protein
MDFGMISRETTILPDGLKFYGIVIVAYVSRFLSVLGDQLNLLEEGTIFL